MAIAKSPISFKSGSIGEMTFSRTNGQTIVRQKQINRRDNKTAAAMTQRAKWLNVTAMQKALTSPYFRMTFANKTKQQSDINAFYSKALKLTPAPFINKEDAERGNVVFAPYIISDGSLGEIGCKVNASYTNVIGLNVATPEGQAPSAPKVGDISAALLANHPGMFMPGDKLTFICLFIDLEQNTRRTEISAFVLDVADNTDIMSVLPSWDVSMQSGDIGYDGAGCATAIAVVHTRKVSGRVLTSRATLVLNDAAQTIYINATKEAALDRAIASIGGLESAAIVDPASGEINLKYESSIGGTAGEQPGGGSETEDYDGLYMLSIMSSDEDLGSVSNRRNGLYAPGSRVDISATPVEGSRFVRWSDGETSEERTIVMNRNYNLVAYFE